MADQSPIERTARYEMRELLDLIMPRIEREREQEEADLGRARPPLPVADG